MIEVDPDKYQLAVSDFRRARRKAALADILGRLRGEKPDLIPYDEVRQRLRGEELPGWELEQIPLDAIVGSVGRYKDFTRGFLPRKDTDVSRWARVEVAILGSSAMPPIQVYRIGDAYFVLDGNHRVSVARQLGAERIQALVKEVETKVPLKPDDRLDEAILKAEKAAFLEATRMDEIRPEAEITLTVPGRYQRLEQEIETQKEILNPEAPQQVPLEIAAGGWYDEVYLPVVGVIRKQGLLREFPGRTEADLYVWISQHLSALEESLGWQVRPEAAAADLAERAGHTLEKAVSRVQNRLLSRLRPETFDPGPAVGEWRQQVLATRRGDQFALDILVALSGEEVSWAALEQALLVAQREGARVLGLHVLTEADTQGRETAEMRAEFEARAGAAGVPFEFAVERGKVPAAICDRARWADLVVLPLAHPPGPDPGSRFGSGFRTLVQRSPRPILAVPGSASPMERALLAYDGSRKSDEALFLAAYLAARWGTSLVIITVSENSRVTGEISRRAVEYVEGYGIVPQVVLKSGEVGETLLDTAREQNCDFFIMGGYGFGPVLEVVMGSAVDQVLREAEHPVLICR